MGGRNHVAIEAFAGDLRDRTSSFGNGFIVHEGGKNRALPEDPEYRLSAP